MENARNIIFGSNIKIAQTADPISIIFNQDVLRAARQDGEKKMFSLLRENPNIDRLETIDFKDNPEFISFVKAISQTEKIVGEDDVLKESIQKDEGLLADLKENFFFDILNIKKDHQPFFLRPLFFKREEMLEDHLFFRFDSAEGPEDIFSWYQALDSSLALEDSFFLKIKSSDSKTALFQASARVIASDRRGLFSTGSIFFEALKFLDPGPGGFGFDPYSFKDGLARFRFSVIEKTTEDLQDLDLDLGEYNFYVLKIAYIKALIPEVAGAIALSASGPEFDFSLNGKSMIEDAVSKGREKAVILKRIHPLLEAADIEDEKNRTGFLDSFIEKGVADKMSADDIYGIFLKMAKDMVLSLDDQGSIANFTKSADRLIERLKTIQNSFRL